MTFDRLPILSSGKQNAGSGKVCAEQAVNWLVSGRLDLGDETDHPSCVHPVLNALSIHVNDQLPDHSRHKMWPLILAQPGTIRPGMESELSIKLGKWCAESVSHLRIATHTATSADAVACRASSAAAYAAEAADYAEAAEAAKAHDAAATAAYATAAATYAAEAAAYATAAATYGVFPAVAADPLLALLAGCQAYHRELTGHVPDPVPLARVDRLAELVGVVA